MSFHHLVKATLFGTDKTDSQVTAVMVLTGFVFTLCQFVISIVQPAPYGRYAATSSSYLNWCPVNAKLAWIFQESPALFIPAILLIESWNTTNVTTKLLIGIFILHYFQRTVIFPLLMRPGSKSPMSTTIMAFLFCFFNGFLQAHTLIYDVEKGTNSKDILWTPTFCLGLMVFFLGFFINIDSDRRLRNLRSQKKEGQQGGYQIPRGGLFKYVSAANYFGEICEWWGFALAAKFNPASLFFAGFTTIFLGMRGLHHHKFYLQKFKEEYPPNRRAVLPFIL